MRTEEEDVRTLGCLSSTSVGEKRQRAEAGSFGAVEAPLASPQRTTVARGKVLHPQAGVSHANPSPPAVGFSDSCERETQEDPRLSQQCTEIDL